MLFVAEFDTHLSWKSLVLFLYLFEKHLYMLYPYLFARDMDKRH